MTTRRTVTDKVISANKERAQRSTGPTTKSGKDTSKLNALKTGLAAQSVLPKHEDSPDPKLIEEGWRKEYDPKGIWEEKLIRDLIFLDRKDAILQRVEENEVATFEAGDVNIFDGDLKLPIDGIDLPIQRGWLCERLTVRATSTEDQERTNAARSQRSNDGKPLPSVLSANANKGNGRSLEFQAELGSAMDRILRYRAAIRRERFKTMQALQTAQSERRQRGKDEREKLEKAQAALKGGNDN